MYPHDTNGTAARSEEFCKGPILAWLTGDEAALDDRRSECLPPELRQSPAPSVAGQSVSDCDAVGVASDYLESRRKSCEQQPEEEDRLRHFEIRPCRCKSRYCEKCCLGMGLRLREKLLPILQTFRFIQMWTLTIDPDLFSSPQEAYDWVKSRRAVSNLIRALKKRGVLHSPRYFYVIEWQKNAMPHFHLLVDASYVSFDLVCEVWNRNRPEWAGPVESSRPGFGSVRFTKSDFESHEHAAHYSCKYLLKHPAEGYPDWVLDSTANIHRYGTSRGFWGEVNETSSCSREKSELKEDERDLLAESFIEECRIDDGPSDGKPSRTIRERISECNDYAVLIEVIQQLHADGEIVETRRFIKELNEPYSVWLNVLGFSPLERFVAVTPAQLEKAALTLLHSREGKKNGCDSDGRGSENG